MYYEVIVASNRIKNSEPLTYSGAEGLESFQIVTVPLQNKTYPALIVRKTAKPQFKTKPIIDSTDYSLRPSYLKWLRALSEYYQVSIHELLKLALPSGLTKNRRKQKDSPPSQLNLKPLNQEQKQVVSKIEGSNKAVLLHGKTGSGKTRVYIELAKRQQKQGSGSVILVPEIGLTSQVLAEFKSSLSDVFVLHSELSEAERHLTWESILKANAPVVIGPRSALFAPIKKLGLIVIDESHESTYKQETAPKYHAIHAAAMKANIEKATLVLGSATPRIEDYYLAENGRLELVEMNQNATGTAYKKVFEIIDLKDSSQFAQSHMVSKQLIKSIQANLGDNRQTLVFHARRGTSTSVQCKECGWIAQCPNCELPLTHHKDWRNLICHICNHKSALITSCPECKSVEIDYRGIGTKRIVEELGKLFPQAKIIRFDSDNLKNEKLGENIQQIKAGDYDIIVGTQGISKGLDLPKLRTVAILFTDTLLNIPDFNTSERAFQTIYQLAGRVSRHDHGNLIMQAYDPSHPVIEFAKDLDYSGFYKWEIANREIAKFPPFVYMAKFTVARKNLDSSIKAAIKLKQSLSRPGLQILGPALPMHSRQNGQYINQLILKSRSRDKLTEAARNISGNDKVELDPIRLL